MTYHAPTKQLSFVINEVLDFDKVAATDKFGEATPELVSAILDEAAKMANEVLAPANTVSDLEIPVLENGVVRVPQAIHDGYNAIAEGGWIGINADPEYGGMGLPITLMSAVGEMMVGGCLSLSLNPLMTQGQIEALEAHASEEIKATYLPKMISGEWCGTMNLTEAQAGSDVGALRSKAEPNGDGSYAITGQKIFISWGDHDLTPNICHLVLARLPDGVDGTKGISLFMVPKFIPNEDGSLGERNTLSPISLEHKMGLHGSPTAIMDYQGAKGWLVGQEHGGMAAMFTMMNNARLGVGIQGLGVAEAAYQHALEYALDRKQGKTPVEGDGTIFDHADVRRMLMEMKALIFMARCICFDTAISLDMAKASDDPAWDARGAFLTPIAKAFGTDIGSEVADLGVQVHGGMGFIEETGAAQYVRDVRVTRIYEGTNGIQAMDMVARKLKDGGAAAKQLLAEVAETGGGAELTAAHAAVSETTDWLLGQDLNERFAGATSYLRAFAYVLGAAYAQKAAAKGGQEEQVLADFITAQYLPEVAGLCAKTKAGTANLYALDADQMRS